jgi:hypothetical protein
LDPESVLNAGDKDAGWTGDDMGAAERRDLAPSVLTKIVDSLCVVADAIRDLEKGPNEAMAHVHASAQVQDEKFEEVERSAQNIAVRTGTKPKDFEGSTVWDSITTLSEQIQDPWEGLDSSVISDMERTCSEMKSEVKGMTEKMMKKV